MSERVSVIWDDDLKEYDFGPGHPLAPLRVQLAMRLAIEFGVLEHENVKVLGPVRLATDDEIAWVHDQAFIDAVHAASRDRHFMDEARGLGTSDVPVFANMHAASARVCGATITACESVYSGGFDHSVSLAGGLHHAQPGAAEGFCVYNDIAVGIAWLLEQGVERIAYLDVDVHHGDGVQKIFESDPRVLTISIHESPRSLFPGTGWPTEIGVGAGEGTAVNVALPAGTGDQGWLRAFHAITPHVLEAFNPQFIVSQHGCDTHLDDPLANLTKSIDGQRMAYQAVHRWAHQFADGNWVALGGGGYEWIEVVPRAWTHLLAEAVGHPIDPKTNCPEGYLAFVTEALGHQAPQRMTDGRDPWPKPFDSGYDPDDAVDQAILATRRAVFPHLGLDVEPHDWF